MRWESWIWGKMREKNRQDIKFFTKLYAMYMAFVIVAFPFVALEVFYYVKSNA